MNDTYISGLIAIGGVFVGWIFSSITNNINNRNENNRLKVSLESSQSNNQKNISVQYITSKRVDWIYEVRSRLAEYISLAQQCANMKVKDKNIKIQEETYRELNVYLAKLRLLFNFDGEDDKKILNLLDSIKDNISETENFSALNFQNDITSLTRHAQVYLKLEWERIKLEIKGKSDPVDEQEISTALSNLKKKYEKEYLSNI